MTEWFNERYISRGEHKQVVAYYEKLVGQLYRKMLDLQTRLDGVPEPDCGADMEQATDIEADGMDIEADGMKAGAARGNVVSVDFRRRACTD